MNRRIFVLYILTFASLFALVLTSGVGRINANAERPGRAEWWVGYRSYKGQGYDSIPVRVLSVTSKAKQGVTRVGVKNNSEKRVTAVKLNWFLSSEHNLGVVLQRGETPLVAPPNGLQPGEKREVSFPVVDFEKVYKPLLRGDSVSGQFRVQIAVSEILYEDGTTWRWTPPRDVAPVPPPEYAHAQVKPTCANQTCKYNGSVYQCMDGTGELCTNEGTSCTSSACGNNND